MKAWLRVAACVVAAATVAAAQDQLSAAKDLYASAAYEEALTTLTRLHEGGSGSGASDQVEQYRAFCLFALGRTSEAQSVAEALITASPLLEIDSADASPRIIAMFSDVRKRLLPALIREQYRSGRAAVEKKDYPAAQSQFTRVSHMLDEADKLGVKDEALGDLRVLVDGFAELIQSAQTRAAAPAAVAPAPPANLTADAATTAASLPAPARIYSGTMDGIVPPVILRQDVPQLPKELVGMLSGGTKTTILDLVIDENGNVERATVRQSTIRMYDTLLTNATRNWRYRPATKGDKPVKYLKTLEIIVKSGPGESPSIER
jgi:hypothetical protein